MVLQLSTKPDSESTLPKGINLPAFLIEAHGDIKYAAELIEKRYDTKVDPFDLVSAIPNLDTQSIFRGIRTSLALQLLDELTLTRRIIMAQEDIPASVLVKFLSDTFSQLTTLITDAPSTTPGTQVNIVNQMGVANDNARQAILERLSVVDSSFTEDRIDQQSQS